MIFINKPAGYQVRQYDQDAECVLVRNEEDEEELDEIHETLQSGLNSTDGSPLVLLYPLLEYLVDGQVGQPQSEPAGDDPCTLTV